MNYDFNLNSSRREDVKLESYKGKKLVLYFYPKNNTSGCTMEVIEFGELYDEFKKLDVEVVGISRDGVKSHQNFTTKYNLPFELLSDKDREISGQYGLLSPTKMYGKDAIKTERATFVFDEESNMIKEFRNVKPAGHAQEVLDYLKSLE